MLDRGLQRGDRVRKRGGDYSFEGVVVSVFQKRADGGRGGEVRCVVEDDRGLLFIFKPSILQIYLTERGWVNVY